MTATLTIQLPREIQLEVENVCHETGKSFSQYFIELHQKNHQPKQSTQSDEIEAVIVKKGRRPRL